MMSDTELMEFLQVEAVLGDGLYVVSVLAGDAEDFRAAVVAAAVEEG